MTNAVAGLALVVTLSNGQTITIPVGQSSAPAPAFAVRADDAYAQGTQTLNVTITGTTGGNFEALTTTRTATTTVTDDADATTVTLTASAATVTEGGSIVYTATLSNAVTGSPVVITLTNGQTITIPVGQSTGTSAAFAVRADDAYVQGTQTLNVGVANQHRRQLRSADHHRHRHHHGHRRRRRHHGVSLTPRPPPWSKAARSSTPPPSTNPVTGAPWSSRSPTARPSPSRSARAPAPAPAFAVRADDAYVQGTQTRRVSITGTTGGNFEAVTPHRHRHHHGDRRRRRHHRHPDAPRPPPSPKAARITYTATVSNAVTGSPWSSTLSNGQTITIPVGQSTGTSAAFAVRADDAYVQGTETLNVTVTGTTGGNFEALTTTGTATTTVTDDAEPPR